MSPYAETRRGGVVSLRNAQNGLEHKGFACEFREILARIFNNANNDNNNNDNHNI